MDETAAREVQALLKTPPVWLRIPAHMEPAFRVWRHRDLARHIRIGAPSIWSLNLILSFVGYHHYREIFEGRDAQLWVRGAVSEVLVLSLGLLLAQLKAVQRHFAWFVVPAAALLVAKFVALEQLLITPAVIFDERFFCVMMVFTTAMALRLTVLQALYTLGGGGALGMLTVLATSPESIDWRGFGYYFFVSSVFSLFMAWQAEEKEKTSFLQSALIAHSARSLHRLNLELSRLAHEDGLSGLPNRREFDRRLSTEWERLGRDQRPLAVLFIDIDNFKAFNDHYGHGAGDECLAKVGSAIGAALCRPADLAARYGGEEFVVILPDTDLPGAMEVARRVLSAVDALAIPHLASNTAPHVTTSIGVACAVPAAGVGATSLLQGADRALYAAKGMGRHTICISEPEPAK